MNRQLQNDDLFTETFSIRPHTKNGCNSIQTILRPYSEDEIVAVRAEQDGIERFGLRNPKYKIKKHSTLAEYRAALGEARFRDLYKFTCVRNPWDRMGLVLFRDYTTRGNLGSEGI